MFMPDASIHSIMISCSCRCVLALAVHANSFHEHIAHLSPVSVSSLFHFCVQQARHQLERALIPPMDGALLEGAIHAGRSCKLLCKHIVHKAEAALREFNRAMQASQRPPLESRRHAEPRGIRPDSRPPRADTRGHLEAGRGRPNHRGNPDPRGHPDPRGYLDPQGHPDYRGPPDMRGQSQGRVHPDIRGQADPRGQRADNRARADARPRAEAPQQRYVPQQPQPDQQRRHGPMAEPHNGRQMAPEYAEAPNNKHPQRGHANPANPPRKGHGARNQAGPAAAAGPANNQGPVVNNAAQPPASHAVAAKPAVTQESDDCVVCWAHVKDVVCVPCGHVAMCKSCSKAVVAQSGLCPVCRVKIREIIQFYKT